MPARGARALVMGSSPQGDCRPPPPAADHHLPASTGLHRGHCLRYPRLPGSGTAASACLPTARRHRLAHSRLAGQLQLAVVEPPYWVAEGRLVHLGQVANLQKIARVASAGHLQVRRETPASVLSSSVKSRRGERAEDVLMAFAQATLRPSQVAPVKATAHVACKRETCSSIHPTHNLRSGARRESCLPVYSSGSCSCRRSATALRHRAPKGGCAATCTAGTIRLGGVIVSSLVAQTVSHHA